MALGRPDSGDDDDASRKVERWWRENAEAGAHDLVHQTDDSTADDLVAEVFIIAMRRHAIVPEPPIGWLLKTARHVVANHRRGRTRYLGMISRVAERQGSRPLTAGGSDAGEHAARVELGALLEGLSANDREVLTLSAWYGLTASEAAEALGITANAYGVRLHRARGHLEERRQALQREHGGVA